MLAAVAWIDSDLDHYYKRMVREKGVAISSDSLRKDMESEAKTLIANYLLLGMQGKAHKAFGAARKRKT